jgi:Raf kinase inhibitor-like YbhB/YbcL family protein
MLTAAAALVACNGTARETAMPDFTLTSTAFADGEPIPRKHTCDGEDVSPDLNWEGVPDGAGALVLVVDDPDARGFVHWLVYDMTASGSGGLPEAVSESPEAPPQGANDFGRIGYGGPCPPSGEHRYVFTLYALRQQLGLSGTPRGGDVRDAMDGLVIAEARLEGRYTRAR